MKTIIAKMEFAFKFQVFVEVMILRTDNALVAAVNYYNLLTEDA